MAESQLPSPRRYKTPLADARRNYQANLLGLKDITFQNTRFNINTSFKLGGRFTFSDNLDGYTSRFSKSNDIYYCLNLTLTRKIRAGRNGLPSF